MVVGTIAANCTHPDHCSESQMLKTTTKTFQSSEPYENTAVSMVTDMDGQTHKTRMCHTFLIRMHSRLSSPSQALGQRPTSS